MRSLAARLMLLLVVAILGVAVVAGFVTVRIVGDPGDGSIERSALNEVRVISLLLGGSSQKARDVGIDTGPRPEGDRIDSFWTRRLIAAAMSAGSPRDVIVTRFDTKGARVLAFPVTPDVYALLPFSRLPPSPFGPVAAYLSLLVIGSAGVSWFAVRKIMRPLRLLEEATASIGANGEILPVEETGPAEVRATAKALNRLSDRLKSAMDSRMRLVAAAGHDLRTPMTRMRLRAEFLPPEDQETWLRDLEELDRIADSAIRLVREEVAEGPLTGDVRLDRMVAEIGRELREIGRKVECRVNLPVLVRARPVGLKRALRNLIDNAALHGRGADVALGIEGEVAVLVVEDRGPGIPADLLERVFEPFFRVDIARRQPHPGAGLGLAIAKEILDGIGGSIVIANRAGGGLRQTVRLRLGEPAA